MIKYKALDIASLFIQLATNLPNNHIDNLKLNKLCYYAQGWSLARFGEPLFSDEIQAWQFGPVIPNVYNAYKGYGSDSIDKAISMFDERELGSEELEVITDVYINYGKYSSAGLIDLTHIKGSPWEQVYVPKQNNIITPDLMKAYFINSNEMQTFQVNDSPDKVSNGIIEGE